MRRSVVVLSLLALAAPASASAAFDPAATVERSPATGTVRFVGLPSGQADAGARAVRAASTPAAAGRAYLEENAGAFGLDGSSVAALATEDVGGGSVVRYQQRIGGVEVLGGQFAVQLTPGRRVRSVMGEAVPEKGIDTTPALSADGARGAAVASVAKAHRVAAADLTAGAASLKVFDSRIMGGPGLEEPQLVWETLVRDGAGTISDRVFIEADRGYEVATISEIHHAKDRTVCDAGDMVLTSVEPNYPCQLAGVKRSEGQPPVVGAGAADINAAYDFAGATYDFFSRFGRDSLDGKGLPLRSTVRFCPPEDPTECPYENAFWDDEDQQMVYGTGFASADDVVGHELTHGVTDFTSGLYYYFQSGAINESLSDVFGEMVDQTSGDDSGDVRWELGEDLPPAIGVIRDMRDPKRFGDPDRMGDARYTDDEGDSGGVHSNSGVNNKAAYLMADGDTFNGQTITGIGIEKTAQIYYRVETAYLTSASDYLDLGTALGQTCSDLVGGPTGITAGDCEQVGKVVAATEMLTNTRGLADANPPACTPGVGTRNWFLDDMEQPGTLARWVPHVLVGPSGPADAPGWYVGSDTPYGNLTYATSGVTQLFGDDLGERRDWAAEQATPVAIRPGARLVFRHAYGFEDSDSTDKTEPNNPNDRERYDGGVVEYTTGTGAGAVWQPLPGVAYPGEISTYPGDPLAGRNPLEGRPAFVNDSRGYVTSVTPLGSLVGQNVRFRFRIGSDSTGGAEGWHIDDVAVTICDGTPPETSIDAGPAEGETLAPGSAPQFAFSTNEQDTAFECRLDGGAFGDCPAAYATPALATGAHTLEVRAKDFVGNVDPSPAARSFTVAAPAGPPVAPGQPTPPTPPTDPKPPVIDPKPRPTLRVAGTPKRTGNRLTFSIDAPAAGTLRVAGTARVKQGKRTRTVTLGTATGKTTSARRLTVRLTLNRATVRLLRTRSLRSTFTVTFTPKNGKKQTVRVALRLPKKR